MHQESDPEDAATVAEAHLLLDDHETAEAWYQGFAGLASIKGVHLDEAVRVLEDIWRLASASNARRASLLALKAAQARQRVGQISISPEERVQVRNSEFQVAHPDSASLRYGVLRQMVEAGACVGWVKDPNLLGVGSGFVIRGADLAPSLGNELYFLTNTHVICDPELALDNRDNGIPHAFTEPN